MYRSVLQNQKCLLVIRPKAIPAGTQSWNDVVLKLIIFDDIASTSFRRPVPAGITIPGSVLEDTSAKHFYEDLVAYRSFWLSSNTEQSEYLNRKNISSLVQTAMALHGLLHGQIDKSLDCIKLKFQIIPIILPGFSGVVYFSRNSFSEFRFPSVRYCPNFVIESR